MVSKYLICIAGAIFKIPADYCINLAASTSAYAAIILLSAILFSKFLLYNNNVFMKK